MSARHVMTRESIKSFAREYDPQPFHLDEEAAKHSLFGELVASGWHSSCVSMRLIVESIHLAHGLVGLGGAIAWLKPVRPDDTIQVESRIIDTVASRSKPGQGVVTVQCTVRNQNGEPVMEFTPKLMVLGAAI